MPQKKLSFHVVHVSGEDDKHPASELNSDKHGPSVQGWTSPKFCLYPIDLIIQFQKHILLKKVQILSHQYLIASKIEFFIGHCNDEEPSYQTAKFTRLGYVELSFNERTDFKARELKSVHVDAEGTFLKLVIHKNFVNRLNVYNQVGIIAINIIGHDISDETYYPYLNNETDPTVLAAVKRPDFISPLDDLAFVMYQDPEISEIIRNLDKKKTEYVLAEQYDEAKRLKQAISELYKIGERLARYDIEKRQAIEEEDYEKAKLKKKQVQEYRTETYRQLQQNSLLELINSEARDNLERKLNGLGSILDLNQPGEHASTHQMSGENGFESQRSARPTNRGGGGAGVVSFSNNNNNNNNNTSPHNLSLNKPSTPYEERVIPALRNTNRSRLDASSPTGGTAVRPTAAAAIATVQENATDGGGGGGGGGVGGDLNANDLAEALVPEQSESAENANNVGDFGDQVDGLEEMSEKEVREAALMIDYLGKPIVLKLYSKNFQHREEAIQEVYNNLNNVKAGDKDEARTLMRATGTLLTKMCKDNVFSVFNSSIRLFQFLVDEFARRHSLAKNEINNVLESVLPVLIHRTGDTNARSRQKAHDCIVDVSTFGDVKPLHTVPNLCAQPIKLHIAPRLALSRVELIESLMRQLGSKDNGLTCDVISKFCAQALEHTSGEVRELATKLLTQMYRENGHTVRRHLPPDNEMNRRNKKYRILYEAFDNIDGKPLQVDAFGTGTGKPNESNVLTTPRSVRNLRTPVNNNSNNNSNKSKTPTRSTSMDRKTPMSMADESELNPDNTCMFCGEVNEKFVKQGFEVHYWKSCPMLKQCNLCKQVIEVAVQTEHLLAECQQKHNFKKCPRCTEAVNTTNQHENELHFKAKQCLPYDKKGNRCPLCHANIGQGEEVWKEHLMSANGCSRNTRKPIPTATSSTLAPTGPGAPAGGGGGAAVAAGGEHQTKNTTSKANSRKL